MKAIFSSVRLSVLSFAFFGFFAVPAVHAQGSAPADSDSLAQSQLNRRIDLVIRAQMDVPANWEIQPGPRKPSAIPGYDSLDVTFLPGADSKTGQTVHFLLSKDGSELARLSSFSLAKIPGTDINTRDRPLRGATDAKVQIIVFDDLECPFCAKMYDELFPKTLDHYKGLIKVVYKDDPMIEIHPWAMHAAVDANCLAGQSGAAYWNYIDHVHQHVDEVTGQDRSVDKSNSFLDRLAEEEGTRSGLDGKSLRRCVTEQGESGIRASIIEAKDLQIDATPALFIGGERFTGAQPVELLWAAIDRALRAEGVVPPPNPYATTTNVRALTR